MILIYAYYSYLYFYIMITYVKMKHSENVIQIVFAVVYSLLAKKRLICPNFIMSGINRN